MPVGHEYPSRTRELQVIEEARNAGGAVLEGTINELSTRRARFEEEWEQSGQRGDPYAPSLKYDKYGEWLLVNYGDVLGADITNFEYTDKDDMARQRRAEEEKASQLSEQDKQIRENISDLPWRERWEEGVREGTRRYHGRKRGEPEDINLSYDDPLTERLWPGQLNDWGEEYLPASWTGEGFETEVPSIRPRGGSNPLVPTRPGPKGSYFDFYVNPGDPRAQSEQEYDKLVNPKPTPSKGGKFVPIKGSEKPKGEPWRNATASQINDRLNQMPDDQATKIRTALGL